MRRRSPAELDLELRLAGLDLELHLQADVIGDLQAEAHAGALELDVVVAGEGVRERAQALGGLAAAKVLDLRDLQELHVSTLGRAGARCEGARTPTARAVGLHVQIRITPRYRVMSTGNVLP